MAISVGIAIQSGTLLQKCGSHWCRYGSSQIVNSLLSNGATASVIAIGASNITTNCSSAWTQNTQTAGMNNLGSGDCNYNSETGLWYDGGSNSPNGYVTGESICVNKGMRLPFLSETTYNNPLKIPSKSSYTWAKDTNAAYHCGWANTSGYCGYYDIDNLYSQCVK